MYDDKNCSRAAFPDLHLFGKYWEVEYFILNHRHIALPGAKKDGCMVFILDGNSEHAAQAWRKIGIFGEKNPICECSRSNQMSKKDQYK